MAGLSVLISITCRFVVIVFVRIFSSLFNGLYRVDGLLIVKFGYLFSSFCGVIVVVFSGVLIWRFGGLVSGLCGVFFLISSFYQRLKH